MHISHDFFSAAIELLIVLGIMVLVHEFGHFAAAKLCGVRVETFSVGFGPRLFGFKRGDTDYRISALPLGGYVKMAGDAVGSEPEEGAAWNTDEFNGHPRWQRIIIAFAGPVANFILTFFLLLGLALFHNEVESYRHGAAVTDYVPQSTPVTATGIQTGDTIVHFGKYEDPTWEDVLDQTVLNLNHTLPFAYTHNGQRTDTTIALTTKATPDNFDPYKFGLIPRQQISPLKVDTSSTSVAAGSPAARAGLLPGDTLLSFNGLALHSVLALHQYLADQAGKPVTIAVERGASGQVQPIAVTLNPVLGDGGSEGKYYQIGFNAQLPPVIIQNKSLPAAVTQAAARTLKYASLIIDIIKGMFTHRVSVKSVSGPIGIGAQVHQTFKTLFKTHSPNLLIELMAFISVNLGIFNLLPIPILDGGMILFLAIESVMRRDLNAQVKERVYQVAFVCLMAFAAFVIFNDITRL